MHRVCGWCKASLGIIHNPNDDRITHGICNDCVVKLTETNPMEELLKHYSEQEIKHHIWHLEALYKNCHYPPLKATINMFRRAIGLDVYAE